MILLGATTVQRRRYGTVTYSDGLPDPQSPTVTDVIAAIDYAPRSDWQTDASGRRRLRTIRGYSYSDWRCAADGAWAADRVTFDGAEYEITVALRLPTDADPEHWEIEGVEVQPLVPGQAPVALAYVVPPSIVGTAAAGEVLAAAVGVVTGTGPISYAYSWTIDGVEAGTSSTLVLPGDYDGETVLLEVTATGATGSPASATSQPLGGGGVVDCAVTCADAIAAAVAAAVAPLNQQIIELEAEIETLQQNLDEVQALYDAAVITIAARDAQILVLEGQLATAIAERDAALADLAVAEAEIAALTATLATRTAERDAALAALNATEDWIDVGLSWVLESAANATIDGTGLISVSHPGGGTTPGTAPTRLTWVLRNADGTPAIGKVFYGPVSLRLLSESLPVATSDVVLSLTSSVAVEAAGSYGVYGGWRRSAAPADTRAALAGGRINGAAWSATPGTARAGVASAVLSGSPIAGSVTGSIQIKSSTGNASHLPGSLAGNALPTLAWGLTTSPNLIRLHLTVSGSALTGTYRVRALNRLVGSL